jgi:hypothetical protein
MHLFSTYIDSQLPPLPQNPDGRPFTSSHFAKTPDKPPQGKNTLAIYQVQMNPPHYVLLDGEDTLEVAKVEWSPIWKHTFCILKINCTHQKLQYCFKTVSSFMDITKFNFQEIHSYCIVEHCVCIMPQHYMVFINEFLGALRICISFQYIRY